MKGAAMRVIFMGTPEFSVPALRAVAAAHEVVAVYSQPPRAAGRGQKPRPSPVHRVAGELGIAVRVPERLRDTEAQAAFAALEAGVAVMQMEAGLDTGAVLAEARTAIGPEETGADLHDRLAVMGAELIVDVLGRLPLPAVAQPAEGMTYAARIDKAEARIDWTRPAVEVDRLIRGLSPFPGAWCEIAGERVKLLRSRLAPGQGLPGAVLSGFRVACGEGAVEILEAQRPGKRPMPAPEMLRGRALPQRLG